MNAASVAGSVRRMINVPELLTFQMLDFEMSGKE